jgi:hypothetical protein
MPKFLENVSEDEYRMAVQRAFMALGDNYNKSAAIEKHADFEKNTEEGKRLRAAYKTLELERRHIPRAFGNRYSKYIITNKLQPPNFSSEAEPVVSRRASKESLTLADDYVSKIISGEVKVRPTDEPAKIDRSSEEYLKKEAEAYPITSKDLARLEPKKESAVEPMAVLADAASLTQKGDTGIPVKKPEQVEGAAPKPEQAAEVPPNPPASQGAAPKPEQAAEVPPNPPASQGAAPKPEQAQENESYPDDEWAKSMLADMAEIDANKQRLKNPEQAQEGAPVGEEPPKEPVEEHAPDAGTTKAAVRPEIPPVVPAEPADTPPPAVPPVAPAARPGVAPAPAPVPAPEMAAAGVPAPGAAPVAPPATEQPPEQPAPSAVPAKTIEGATIALDIPSIPPAIDSAVEALKMEGFSAYELDSLRKNYKEYDLDKDGEITADEIVSGARAAKDEAMSKSSAQKQKTWTDVLDAKEEEVNTLLQASLDARSPEEGRAILAKAMQANRDYGILKAQYETDLMQDAYGAAHGAAATPEQAVVQFEAERREFIANSQQRLDAILSQISSDELITDDVGASAWRIASKLLSSLFIGIGAFGATLTKSPNYAFELFKQAEAEERARQRSLLQEASNIRANIRAAFGGNSSRAATAESLARTRAVKLAVDMAKNTTAPYGVKQQALNAALSAVGAQLGVITDGFVVSAGADADRLGKLRAESHMKAVSENRQRTQMHFRGVQAQIDNDYRERVHQSKLSKADDVPTPVAIKHGEAMAVIDGAGSLLNKYVEAREDWDKLSDLEKAAFAVVSSGISGELQRLRSGQGTFDKIKDYITTYFSTVIDDELGLRENHPKLFEFLATHATQLSKFVQNRSGAAVSDQERAFLSMAMIMLNDPIETSFQKTGDFVKATLSENYTLLNSLQKSGANVSGLFNITEDTKNKFATRYRGLVDRVGGTGPASVFFVPPAFTPDVGESEELMKQSKEAQRTRLPIPSGKPEVHPLPPVKRDITIDDVPAWYKDQVRANPKYKGITDDAIVRGWIRWVDSVGE